MAALGSYDGEEYQEYDIYPPNLKSPYRDSRFKIGEDMYALLGIEREDKQGRYAHLARNFKFLMHRRPSFASSISVWVRPNGLIWACFYKPLCF